MGFLQLIPANQLNATYDSETRMLLLLRAKGEATFVAPGCYRIGPDWFSTFWIAANELPLVDELVPFLVARTGQSLDAFVRWVKARRPLPGCCAC